MMPRRDQVVQRWIIFAVGFFMVAWCAEHRSTTPTSYSKVEATPTGVATDWANDTSGQIYCSKASAYRAEALQSFNAHAYRDSYKNAVSGLSANESCSDENEQLENKAYLTASKGLAEHYLPEGDSRTDLNLAGMLLEQCTTKPGLYATEAGAACETEQKAIISWQTSWDMGQ